jgi:hypothetical protein
MMDKERTTLLLRVVIVLILFLILIGCEPSSQTAIENPPLLGTQEQRSLTATTHPQRLVYEVPSGSEPVLDGVHTPNEWNAARVERFSDGSELFLMHDENFLYVAVRGSTPEMIVGNIFIDRGYAIAIMHTSAALGTAIYTPVDGSWVRTEDFEWRCRQTRLTASAEECWNEFLNEEHWLAAIARMGTPNELEYKIKWDGTPMPFTINLVRSSDPEDKSYWPESIDDDSIAPTVGGFPAEMKLEFEDWSILEIQTP